MLSSKLVLVSKVGLKNDWYQTHSHCLLSLLVRMVHEKDYCLLSLLVLMRTIGAL
nr:hypothetical protein Cduv_468 [Cedratvirus duvanny]